MREREKRLLTRKKVITALRNRPMRHNELVKETGIYETTLERILKELKIFGLVEKVKDEKGTERWAWYDYVMDYESERDRDLAIQHSEKLIPGLEGLLREGWDPAGYEAKAKARVRYTLTGTDPFWYGQMIKEENELKPSVEQHLKTGHPAIFKKLTKFRQLSSDVKKLYNARPTFYSQPRAPPDENDQKEYNAYYETQTKMLEAYRELAGDIQLLKRKIIVGPRPLEGKCDLCRPQIRRKR